jgi:transcription elongation factor Elf1
MNMIISKGFKSTPELRTFECLRCGHVKAPQQSVAPARAA